MASVNSVPANEGMNFSKSISIVHPGHGWTVVVVVVYCSNSSVSPDMLVETTEQQVSTVEEDSPKQLEPDLPDIELPDDDPNKPTPSTSKNVLSNGLKRPLPDGVDREKKKKLRLTEVSKLKADYDKLEVTNKDDSGKNQIQILNKSSSSDTLAITENSDHKNVSVFNDIQATENITTAVNGVKKVSKESFPQLLNFFSRKELTYDQFDSMCTQKFIAMMTSSKYFGKYYSELQSFKKRKKIWRSKYTSLFRKIKEMEPIVNAYKQQLQSNEYASPHKITGTVGLPAVACPKKKGSIKLPKQAIPMPKPDPVSISVEDDDDVVILEFEKVVTASSSTSKITNTTTKKDSTMSHGSRLVNRAGHVVPTPPLVRAGNMTPVIGILDQQQQLRQQQIITTPQTQHPYSDLSVHGRLTNTQQRNALRNARPVAISPPFRSSPPSSPVPPAVQENSFRPNIAWELTRIPERILGLHDTSNSAAYKIQKAILQGRTLHCINANPYIYLDLMVTLDDLVQMVLPSCTATRCAYLLNKYLKTTLFSGNSEQLAVLRENGLLRSMYPDDTPMAMLQDVTSALPQLNALIVLNHDEKIQQYQAAAATAAGPAKRQRTI